MRRTTSHQCREQSIGMFVLAGPFRQGPDGMLAYRPIGFKPLGSLGLGDLIGPLSQGRDPQTPKTATTQ